MSPVEESSSSRFNPLSEIRLFTPRDVSDAQNIANMIVRTGEGSPQERYWQVARGYCQGCCAELFGYQPRTATLLCQRWVEDGFLETTDHAKRSRRYKLNNTYEAIIDDIE